jgi:FKBP-type peptidyl-prolyl cis-trans isomerase
MKRVARILLAAGALAMVITAVRAEDAAPAPAPAAKSDAKLTTDAQKTGYAMGMQVGMSIQRMNAGDKVDTAAIVAGLQDMLAGKEPALGQDEVRAVLEKFEETMRAEFETRQNAEGAANQKKGADFLAANAKAEGVKTTASGLQYKVITEGKGEKPKATSVVKVHYRGTLLDGTEFDSSYARQEPAEFPLNRVVPGWTEGLQLMTVGSKYQMWLPSTLAYGPEGQGPIPPHATLVFEVELLEIVK